MFSSSSGLGAHVHKQHGYRPDIDGLRAVAIATVVLFHANMPGLSGGFVGVDVFFVISGFLIGSIIYREVQQTRFSFTRFYARRARRILPALLMVSLATMIAGILILTPSELEDLAKSVVAALLAVSNEHFFRSVSYFKPDAALNPMLMTWSLGVEEQFYLAFPFLLLATRRLRARTKFVIVCAATIASLALCVVLTTRGPAAAFYRLPSRAWELGAGVLFAIYLAHRCMPWGAKAANVASVLGALGLVASVVFLDEKKGWPGFWAILPVASTVVLISTPHGVFNRKVLASRPFVGVGLLSYSWYLWHWPLMAFLRISSFGEPSAFAMSTVVIASLCLGFLSWRFVEQPFREVRWSDGSTLAGYAAVLGAGAAAAMVIVGLNGLPSRFPPGVRNIEDQIATTHDFVCLRGDHDNRPEVSEPCVRRLSRRPTIAIVGDSHAAALAPAIQSLAARSSFGSAVFAKSSCRPLLGITIAKRSNPRFADGCLQYMAATLDWLARQPDVRTVVLVGYWTGGNENETLISGSGHQNGSGADLLREGVAAAAKRLVSAGKVVFVTEDVPHWDFEPGSVAVAQYIPARAVLQQFASSVNGVSNGYAYPAAIKSSIQAAAAAGAASGGARYVGMSKDLCLANRCRYADADGLIYADHSHLTSRGALLAMRSVWPQIQASVAGPAAGPQIIHLVRRTPRF